MLARMSPIISPIINFISFIYSSTFTKKTPEASEKSFSKDEQKSQKKSKRQNHHPRSTDSDFKTTKPMTAVFIEEKLQKKKKTQKRSPSSSYQSSEGSSPKLVLDAIVAAHDYYETTDSDSSPTLSSSSDDEEESAGAERKEEPRDSLQSKTPKHKLGFKPSKYPDWVIDERNNYTLLHEPLFKFGVIAFKPTDLDTTEIVTSNSYAFGSRTLQYGDAAEIKSLEKPAVLLKELQAFADKNDSEYQIYLSTVKIRLQVIFEPRKGLGLLEPPPSKYKPGQKKRTSIPDIIQEYADDISTGVVYNPPSKEKHVEEIFSTFIVNRGHEPTKFGLKLYPWLSQQPMGGKFKLTSGFDIFAIELCMFGATLEAEDSLGARFPLIKHDIRFYDDPEHKIETIHYVEPSFYEIAQFAIFEKLTYVIEALSNSNPRKLYCHLPYYDYILFGVELFIRGRITPEALDMFFVYIFEKKEGFIHRLQDICKEHNIEIVIESPFDNLFGKLDGKKGISKDILKKLSLSDKEQKFFEGSTTKTPVKEREKIAVQRCIDFLTEQFINKRQQMVWKDFVSIANEKEGITTFKDLLKIANAVMIGVAASGEKEYKVCSLMPLSGKQIQRGYVHYSSVLQKYPSIVNLTFLDPIIGYGNKNKGLAFYYQDSQHTAGMLIKRGMFKAGSKNAASSTSTSIYSSLPLPSSKKVFVARRGSSL